jgi:hypothetical protein
VSLELVLGLGEVAHLALDLALAGLLLGLTGEPLAHQLGFIRVHDDALEVPDLHPDDGVHQDPGADESVDDPKPLPVDGPGEVHAA